MTSATHVAKISGTGRYLPGQPIDSEQLIRVLPRAPVGLFEQYFGVTTRHYVIDPESGERRSIQSECGKTIPLTTTEMGAQAAFAAIADAGIDIGDIDAVITNSTTPDGLLPPFALLLQRRLAIPEAQLLDLRGGCSASVQALNVATMLVESGRARSVLIVGSECTSQHYFRSLRTMPKPRFTDVVNGLLFADGASAVLVERAEICAARRKQGITITHTGTQSCFPDDDPGFVLNSTETRHDNRAISKTLPHVIARGYRELERATGHHRDDFDVMIIPQVNQSMVQIASGEAFAAKLPGICYYGSETGNVPAAAMFMALDIARERGRISPDDRVGILSIETTSWNYAIAALRAEATAS